MWQRGGRKEKLPGVTKLKCVAVVALGPSECALSCVMLARPAAQTGEGHILLWSYIDIFIWRNTTAKQR